MKMKLPKKKFALKEEVVKTKMKKRGKMTIKQIKEKLAKKIIVLQSRKWLEFCMETSSMIQI